MRGLAMRYRRAGLGAPLAASVKPPEQSPRLTGTGTGVRLTAGAKGLDVKLKN